MSHCDVTLGVAFCWQQHSIAILFSSDIAVVVALNLQVTEVVMALFLCSDELASIILIVLQCLYGGTGWLLLVISVWACDTTVHCVEV